MKMSLIKDPGFSDTIEALEVINEYVVKTHTNLDTKQKEKTSKFIKRLCKYLKSQDNNEQFITKQKYN
jgi:hypothetical protein